MCWNADISINTFLFSCFTLIFIYITNTYTRYKTPYFDNPLMYLFVFSVSVMQLVEFFLWRNLKNKDLNYQFSKMALYVILLQQVIIMFMIPTLAIRYSILAVYCIFIFLFMFYFKKLNNPINYHTSIAKNGHLSWDWINYKGYENIWIVIFLLFYIVPAFFTHNIILLVALTITLLISLFFYFRDNTFGTMWCWGSNLLLLYFIINILIVQPFYEYNGLC